MERIKKDKEEGEGEEGEKRGEKKKEVCEAPPSHKDEEEV